MSLLNEIMDAIKNGKCPPIFKPSDLEEIGIKDLGRNLSNYDKKNDGTSHENALVSRKIGSEVYYTFDDNILPENALNCTEDDNGTRFYIE